MIINDKTMWCASYVHGCLNQAGHKGAGANNYLKWGKHLENPVYGAIAVF